MTIHPISGDGAAGAAGSKRSEAADASASRANPVAPSTPATPADQVEISGEGRVLARLAEMADELGLDAHALRTIQQRLAGGFYERPEVLDEVAVRLLTSGDLSAHAPEEGS